MDLQKQFQDLNLDENIEKDAFDIEQKNNAQEAKVVEELQMRLKQARGEAKEEILPNEEEEVITDEVLEDSENQKTFYEKIQPFILPICLTFFAIIFAGLFLYFFSKSRIEKSVNAIVNTGVVEVAPTEQQPITVVVKDETVTCNPPQILNEAKDGCIDVATTTPVTKSIFENGTTTIVHVKFSYDKFNYDNPPRGIYLLEDQLFDGDFVNYKLNPTNRAFANDHFFGVHRYTVSLIGSCSYVIDDAQIYVKDINLRNNYFTGNVVKVLEASKPYVDCKK